MTLTSDHPASVSGPYEVLIQGNRDVLSAAELWFARVGQTALTWQDRQWPACCRGICQGALSDWDLDRLTDPVLLVVSELATNALLHARGSLRMAIALKQPSVRVEVRDSSPGPVPWRGESSAEDEQGRGLLLVGVLADVWGVTCEERYKTVWCEFAISGAHPALDALVRLPSGPTGAALAGGDPGWE